MIEFTSVFDSPGLSACGSITTYFPFSTDKMVEFAKLGGNAFMKSPDTTDFSRLVINDKYSAPGFDWKLANCPCRGMVVCRDTTML